MADLPFVQLNELDARALFVGQRIDHRAFEKTQRYASSPLTVSAGTQGVAVLFRYGVVVMFGLNAVEEANFIKEIRPFVEQPFEDVESESLTLLCTPESEGHIENNAVYLHDLSLPRIQIVADVLAKSVILGHYEAGVSQTFDRIEPLASKLQAGRGFMNQGRELLSHIGDVLLIHGKMVGRVEVSEKPDLLWNQPQYGRLYAQLEDEFELRSL